MGDIYFWRQLYIMVTSNLLTTSEGLMLAFPSIMSPELLSKNSTDIEVTSTQMNWIVTSNGIAGIFGFLILSPIMQIYGRKVTHVVDSLALLIGWIIFVRADNFWTLLAARIFHGFNFGSLYIDVTIIGEYSDPKRRGYFITFQKATVAMGILMCHALSLIWNWRQIAIFALILPILSILMTYFWPESPYYLAMKSRFEESEKSFVWLHGKSNMKEFHLLQASQMQMKEKVSNKKSYKFLFKKAFLKPCMITFLLSSILEFSGRYYFTVYAIQLMVELIEDKSLALYLTVGSDTLALISLLFSSFIISYFRRRTVLFSFGVAITIIMLIICLVIVFKSSSVVWLAPTFILLLNVITNCGITPVCFTFFGEIFPLEYKGWGSCINGFIYMCMYTLLMTLTPFLIENTGVGGVFGTYGIIVALSLLVLYFIVSETKDRTLQEIENEFKGIVLLNCDEILQMKQDNDTYPSTVVR